MVVDTVEVREYGDGGCAVTFVEIAGVISVSWWFSACEDGEMVLSVFLKVRVTISRAEGGCNNGGSV